MLHMGMSIQLWMRKIIYTCLSKVKLFVYSLKERKLWALSTFESVSFKDNSNESKTFVKENETQHPPATIRARKLVVVSAGALSTPLILERSGIGSQSHLQSVGLKKVVSDLPGVGVHLQDHPIVAEFVRVNANPDDTSDDIILQNPETMARAIKEYETGKVPLATNSIDAAIKLRPTEEEVKSMGPEFEKYWSATFAGKPDKSMIFIIYHRDTSIHGVLTLTNRC